MLITGWYTQEGHGTTLEDKGFPGELACEGWQEGWVGARVWGEDVDGRPWLRGQNGEPVSRLNFLALK